MASFENVWQTCKIVQQFDELFSQMKYKEAAHLVAAYQGLLRTPYIVAKFQNVPVQPNQPAAVLQYFGTILIYDKLTPFEMDAFEPFLPSQIFANQNMDVDNNLPSNSVDIISYGEAFEPYQSHFARELSDEIRRIEKDRKRSRDLLNWKSDEVIDLDKDESNPNGDEEGGEEGDEELVDTADSAVTRPVKIPRAIVRFRGSVHHVGDAAADEPHNDKSEGLWVRGYFVIVGFANLSYNVSLAYEIIKNASRIIM